MTTTADASDAGALIGFGFGGRPPSDGSEYGRVYERYRTERNFQDLVDAFASGLGLWVVGKPPSGIVLAAKPGSPFVFRLSDLGLSSEDQQLFGLVLLGLAALAYPTEAQLDATAGQFTSVGRVERFLRAAVLKIKDLPAEESSFEAWTASAARVFEARPAFIPTPKEKRAAKGCTQKTIEDVFEWLWRQKMVTRAGPAYPAGTYLLTDRFRIMVGELAGSDAFEVLRGLGRAQPPVDTEVPA